MFPATVFAERWVTRSGQSQNPSGQLKFLGLGMPRPTARCVELIDLYDPLGEPCQDLKLAAKGLTIFRNVEICISNCFSSFDKLGCLMPRD